MSKHQAVVTVEFPRPVKGSELIGGVKAIIDEGGVTSFISEQSFDNGDVFVIGQSSGYPYDHVLVSPTRKSAGIRPDQTYNRVEVMDTSWPVSIYLVGYPDDAPVRKVRKFAEKLKAYFDDQPQPSEVSVWPQEIKVCAICELIVWSNDYDESFNCPTHGKNSPVKLMKIMPAGE